VNLFGTALTLLVLVVATAMLEHTVGPHPPEGNADRSVGVFLARLRGDNRNTNGPPGWKLLDLTLRGLPGAEHASIHSAFAPAATYQTGKKVDFYLKRVDAEFFRVFTLRFLEGGPFSDAEEKTAARVAVINAATRRKLFGADSALGKTLETDGQRFRVIGVVEDVSMLRLSPFADVWVPITTFRGEYRHELVGSFLGTIVARSRADLPGIREEYRRRVATVPVPEGERLESFAETLPETVTRELGFSEGGSLAMLAIVAILALLFMALPAINLVNLNVSRILERASEIGVRKSFGATSRRLVGQFVFENVLLSLAGGALGLLASVLVLHAINAAGFIPYAKVGLNLPVFAAGLVFALVFGVLSGTYPAFRMSRLHPVVALRGGN
jgi:putative ABC transport system permease protein